MDGLQDLLDWAWARHHNPLSWYIRPLFVLPFCFVLSNGAAVHDGTMDSQQDRDAALVPAWFVACAWACWRRSWVGGFVLITAGTLLKVAWSFYFGGESGWTIVPPAAVGFVVCTVILWYAHRRVHRLEDIHA
jgi:hypothetical protein